MIIIIIEALSKISWYFLIVMAVLVFILVLLVLKELIILFKELEVTESKINNMTQKLETMDNQAQSSLEFPKLLSFDAYQDLHFDSDLMNAAFGFTVDNSDSIVNYTSKIVRGYKWAKKKRKK